MIWVWKAPGVSLDCCRPDTNKAEVNWNPVTDVVESSWILFFLSRSFHSCLRSSRNFWAMFRLKSQRQTGSVPVGPVSLLVSPRWCRQDFLLLWVYTSLEWTLFSDLLVQRSSSMSPGFLHSPGGLAVKSSWNCLVKRGTYHPETELNSNTIDFISVNVKIQDQNWIYSQQFDWQLLFELLSISNVC